MLNSRLLSYPSNPKSITGLGIYNGYNLTSTYDTFLYLFKGDLLYNVAVIFAPNGSSFFIILVPTKPAPPVTKIVLFSILFVPFLRFYEQFVPLILIFSALKTFPDSLFCTALPTM